MSKKPILSMAEASDVKVLKQWRVGPPPGSLPSTSLPLTFLDLPWLFCPPIQRIFFYQFPSSSSDHHHFLQQTLQHSLSLALLHFFPLSANLLCPPPPLKPHILYVDGDSVPFTVAESTARFSHLTADHPRDVLRDLHSLLPALPSAQVLDDGTHMMPLMAIQLTLLPHSGFTIGITFRHVAADGRSIHHFIKSWASICRSQGSFADSKPCYKREEVKRYYSSEFLEISFLKEWWNYVDYQSKKKPEELSRAHVLDNRVRTTVVLKEDQIQKLKNWASTHDEVPHVSTFVVTCALIWVCLLKSEDDDKTINLSSSSDDDEEEDDGEYCYFVFVADCRNRYELVSISSTYYGNCLALCFLRMKRKEVVGESGVEEAMKAIGKKIKEIMEKGALRDAEKWMVRWKEAERNPHLVTPKLASYETDFGWGRPKKTEVFSAGESVVISIGESRNDDRGLEIGLALPKLQMDRFHSILKHKLESEML